MANRPLKSRATGLAILLLALPLAAEDAPAPVEEPVPDMEVGAGATQSEAAPPGPALTADASSRCRQAVLRSVADEGAWCDVLINALNRQLTRTPTEDARLLAAYHNRAVLAVARADFEAAEADLAAAMALRPDHAGLYLATGQNGSCFRVSRTLTPDSTSSVRC